MRASLLLVSLTLALGGAPTHALTLTGVCKRACASVAADCQTKTCRREVMRKCHLEGPQFCLPICTPGDGTGSSGAPDTTTTTTTTTPATTGEISTTTLPPIGIHVDSFGHEVYLGAPQLVMTITVTNTGGLSGITLDPNKFSLRQSGATHTIITHTIHLPQRCGLSIVVAPNASAQCAIAFEMFDDETQRTLAFRYGDGVATVSTTF